MPIWVFIVRYEGEVFCSTHFTEKGAYLNAIYDVLEYLGVEEEQYARSVCGIAGDEDKDAEPPEWDHEKLQKMKANELIGIFGEWVEYTWDHFDYDVEVEKTMVRA